MVEEMPQPHINAPKAMVLAVIIGSSSSFVFLIALLGAINQATGESSLLCQARTTTGWSIAESVS